MNIPRRRASRPQLQVGHAGKQAIGLGSWTFSSRSSFPARHGHSPLNRGAFGQSFVPVGDFDINYGWVQSPDQHPDRGGGQSAAANPRDVRGSKVVLRRKSGSSRGSPIVHRAPDAPGKRFAKFAPVGVGFRPKVG